MALPIVSAVAYLYPMVAVGRPDIKIVNEMIWRIGRLLPLTIFVLFNKKESIRGNK